MTDTAVVPGVEALDRRLGPLFVVVGVFDGLHRGHAYLLDALREEAPRRGARAAVITFDHHPDEVLVGAAPPLLLDPEERLARLSRAGVEVTVVQHFDRALRETPYDRFVGMISSRCPLAGFLMTPDAAFGHERRGTPESLADLGSREGFEVAVIPPFELGGQSVRSSDIRGAIADADLATARTLLGRDHAVTGSVAGRELMQFDVPVALPPPGDYDVTIEPAWTRQGSTGQARAAGATVVDGGLRVEGAVPGRWRIAFRARGGAGSTL